MVGRATAHEGPFADDQFGIVEPDRLFNEANLLRLEGRLFCFDPKEAGRRESRAYTFEQAIQQPVIIEPHPNFGYPSTLAYKVLQAISKKLTEEGFPVPESVSFSQRELARLIGRPSFGGAQSMELYRAIMQLHTTRIQCSFYDKRTHEWASRSIHVLYDVAFSGKKRSISICMASLHPRIVESLNNKHYACINWQRLMTLEPIGMALYKRLFYHFTNLHHPSRAKEELRFEKDYEALCGEWLGGLKPEKYRSKILQTQLGRHFDALKTTRLVRQIDIERRVNGEGLKLVAVAGRGFFEDYEEFYVRQAHPQLRFKQTAALREVQHPLSLVAHFHKLMGREHRTFEDKETIYAAELLERHSVEEMRDLVGYAVEEARKTRFPMQFFTAVKVYAPRWERDKARRAEDHRRRAAVSQCPLCNQAGLVPYETEDGRIVLSLCTHDPAAMIANAEERHLRSMSSSWG